MNLQSLIYSSAELLKVAMKFNNTPDKIISEIFRKKKYFGSKDRKFISEVVFSSLRNLILYKYLAVKLSDNDDKMELKIIIINCILSSKSDFWFKFNIIALLEKLNSSYEELFNVIKSIVIKELLFTVNEINNFNKILFLALDNLLKSNNRELDNISTIYSMPLWIFDKLSDSIKLIDFCKNSLISAPAFIRVNLSITDGSVVEDHFKSSGVKIRHGNLSPAAFMFDERLKLDDNELFRNGFYEIQDEGSQLISYALSPVNNSKILDACAGAGGKSLHLADMTSDTAEIIASDTEFGRLKEIEKRAKRCGFKSIKAKHIKMQDFESLKKLFGYKQFDYVLVDAPCSGMGTIRRDPSRKYKLNEGLLQRLADKQYRILNQYSHFVRKGGILVYSTCSVLKDENEAIIDKFLANNSNFVGDNLFNVMDNNGISIPHLKDEDYCVTVAFDKYFTDGFFMARLIRID